jgi:hypothetical protein
VLVVRTRGQAVTEHECELIARRVAELIGLEEPWLGKAEIAEHFGCSTRSIELAMKKGLPYRLIFGRSKFRASAVQAWLDAQHNADEGSAEGSTP